MTPILQDYIKIKETANDSRRNLIEITFKKMEDENSMSNQYVTLDTVGA